MYDITKTRMLLTTAVFAAVAALFAGGANARIPTRHGSGFEGQTCPSAGRRRRPGAELAGQGWQGRGDRGATARQVSLGDRRRPRPQGPSWQGKGGKGDE